MQYYMELSLCFVSYRRLIETNKHLIKFSSCPYLHVRCSMDRLCGLLVRVSGYRSRRPGSIPCDTRFSEKWWVWNGVHSASWVQLRSYLGEKSSGYDLENRDYDLRESATLTTRHPSIRRSWCNFVDKRRSLGRYKSTLLADSGHGV
jgi:hypothetical protein